MIDKYEKYTQLMHEAYRPDPRLTVDEWSDRYRYLSNKSSAEPGLWRTSRTPYLKEIMRRLSADDPTEQVVFKKGAQVGGTEVGNNWLGYIIDHMPAPTLFVQPTIDMAKRNSRQRIAPLIEESPRLKDRVVSEKSRQSGNTMLSKEFVNGILVMAGANSGAGLRSMPARFLFCDEIDVFPGDVDGEGSPISLAKARTRTFSRRKFFFVSTPTIEGMSPIDAEFQASKRHYYHVPCPHCDFKQILIFERLKWDDNDPATTRYVCSSCEKPIYNYQKTPMLDGGEWVCENPDDKIKNNVGFHISALYSPVGWYSWESLVEEWIKAQSNVLLLKAFVNTVLGECWKDKSDVPDWNRLYERRSNYKVNTIPKRVCMLTAGVDIQADRIELEIVGWCRNKVTYSIDYRIFPGDTANLNDECWSYLSKVLTEVWQCEQKGRTMSIKMIAVDSGYNTQTVYSWARKEDSSRVMVVKGQDNLMQIHAIPKHRDVAIDKKNVRRGIRVWPVGVSVAKQELYGWLKQPMATSDGDEAYGFCYFPQYGEEFFKMLTAEELVYKVDARGNKKGEWKKVRARNEALDCRIYARAAASVQGIDRFTNEHWEQLETQPFSTKMEPTRKNKTKKRENDEWL